MGQRLGREHAAVDACRGSVATDVVRAGVRVLHVEDRVVVRPLLQDVQVDVEVRVRRTPGEGVAGSIHPDCLDEVLQRHDRSGTLGHPHRLALAQQVHHLADEDLQVHVRLVAERCAHRHEALDVAVVIGTEHDDATVEAPLALVEVVRQVAGDVGRLTVALDDDAVFVVAEVGRAQPDGTVCLVDVAEIAQPVDGAGDRAGRVQIVLVEVHVEIDTELVEALLDLVEHEPDAELSERLLLGLGIQRTEIAVVGIRHSRRDVGDVCPAVSVLGRRAPLGRGDKAPGEPVDLRAVIVEVVLPRHACALGGENAGKGVADCRPPGAADVDRSCRVRRHELQVDDLTVEHVRGPERGTRVDDRLRERARGCGIQSNVDESGAGDLDARDPLDLLESGRDLRRKLPRVGADALRELECGVGGPVTVIAVLGTLQWQVGGGEIGCRTRASRLRQGRDDGEQGGGEGFGIHGRTSLGAPRACPIRRRSSTGPANKPRDGEAAASAGWFAVRGLVRVQASWTRDVKSAGAVGAGASAGATQASTRIRSRVRFPPW